MMKIFLLVVVSLISFSAIAGEADVVDVKAKKVRENTYRFDVTVLHGDTGWEHYADKWDITDKQGNIIATRTLHHPHENEQPFTRSLPSVEIPEHIKQVVIRGHDSVHQYGGKTITVELPQ